jgi:hypothetical protein
MHSANWRPKRLTLEDGRLESKNNDAALLEIP